MSDGDLPWNKDAPEGMAWACPDCEARATLGGNAAFHANQTGHGRPQLVALPKRPQQGVSMNPIKLKFKHGGEMLVSPIGLRFVEDPDHGPLVLIPEAQGPKAYQLDMTLEEAEQAFRADQTQVEAIAKKVYWLQEQLDKAEKGWTAHELRLDDQLQATHSLEARIREFGGRLTGIEARFGRLFDDYCRHEDGNDDRWQALAIHLGLPEGWEHLHEGAAEVKGALVSQAEEIDELASRLRSVENHKALQPIFWERLLDTLGYIELSTDEGVHFGLAGGLGLSFEVRKLERQVGELRQDAARSWELRSQIQEELRDLILERVERLEQGMIDRVGGLERLTGCLSTYGIVRSTVENLQAELSLLKEEASLFTLAERVGELEESRSRHRKRLARLESWKNEVLSELSEKREGAVFPAIDDRATAWSGDWWDTVPTGLRGGVNYYDRDKSEPEKPKSAWKPLSEAPTRRPVFARASGDVECYSVTRAQWDGRHWAKRGGAGSIALAPASAYEFCPIPE